MVFFQFLCVGTPQSSDGSPNLKFIREAIKGIAANAKSRKIIINKSTVPVGMTDIVREIVLNQINIKIVI